MPSFAGNTVTLLKPALAATFFMVARLRAVPMAWRWNSLSSLMNNIDLWRLYCLADGETMQNRHWKTEFGHSSRHLIITIDQADKVVLVGELQHQDTSSRWEHAPHWVEHVRGVVHVVERHPHQHHVHPVHLDLVSQTLVRHHLTRADLTLGLSCEDVSPRLHHARLVTINRMNSDSWWSWSVSCRSREYTWQRLSHADAAHTIATTKIKNSSTFSLHPVTANMIHESLNMINSSPYVTDCRILQPGSCLSLIHSGVRCLHKVNKLVTIGGVGNTRVISECWDQVSEGLSWEQHGEADRVTIVVWTSLIQHHLLHTRAEDEK